MEIIFKGISSTDFGLGVKKIPPIPQAQADIEKIEIPGRNGFLTNDLGTFRAISIPVEFNFVGKDVPENSLLIKNWLQGNGDLIFSNNPSMKYKATVINPFDITSAIKFFGEFVVIFECQPHRYDINDNYIELASSGTIYNHGTTYSTPGITVFGNGNIDLIINGTTINLTNITDSIIIDSTLLEAYNDTELLNNKMNGEFPLLKVGENTINWTGDVTKIRVVPNWRWI